MPRKFTDEQREEVTPMSTPALTDAAAESALVADLPPDPPRDFAGEAMDIVKALSTASGDEKIQRLKGLAESLVRDAG